MPFHGHTIVLTALQALSRPLQQPEGPSKSLSKMERKKCFVEAVCAGPGHENAVEAVQVLGQPMIVLLRP